MIAVAHAQLEIIHTLLSRRELYTDLAATSSNVSSRSRSPGERSDNSKLGQQVILKDVTASVPT